MRRKVGPLIEDAEHSMHPSWTDKQGRRGGLHTAVLFNGSGDLLTHPAPLDSGQCDKQKYLWVNPDILSN